MLILIKYLSSLISLFLLFSGLLIIASIYFSLIGWVINILVGAMFIIISKVYYSASLNFIEFIYINKDSTKLYSCVVKDILFGRVILFFIFLVIFCMVCSRVFLEHKAVFG